MTRNMPWLLMMLSLGVAAAAAPGDGPSGGGNATSTTTNPAPAPSMHRLVSSVVDDATPPSAKSVSSSSSSEGRNASDGGAPFLPAVPSPPSPSPTPYSSTTKPVQSQKFTPSYFLGEVIPEPYVPERFLRRNATSRLVPSQSAVATRHVPPPRPQTKRHGVQFPTASAYVPPVHEEPVEDVAGAAAADMGPGCCGGGLQSTRPLALDDGWRPPPAHSRKPLVDHPYQFDVGGGVPLSQSHDWQLAGAGADADPPPDDGPLVLPSPFYPTGPALDYRHKDVPYKLYSHEPPAFRHRPHLHPRGSGDPLKGLLRAAAALLPVGLLVASLYPSVVHVDASPPMGMPAKGRRSLEDEDLTHHTPLPSAPQLMHLTRSTHEWEGEGEGGCQRRRALCQLIGDHISNHSPDVVRSWRTGNGVEGEGVRALLDAAESGACHTLACR